MNKTNDLYKRLKRDLGLTADGLGFTDKPRRRMILNDTLDLYIREINSEVFHERLSEKRANQFINWLTDYTIKRHEK